MILIIKTALPEEILNNAVYFIDEAVLVPQIDNSQS